MPREDHPVVARTTTVVLHTVTNCTTFDSLFILCWQVALGHMSCLVEDNGGEQRVTFLYKLAPGPCPKSFGINVARLAQLPDAVSMMLKTGHTVVDTSYRSSAIQMWPRLEKLD